MIEHLLGFKRHTPLTDPGRYAEAVSALPDDVEALVNAVRGMLVHDAYLDLYGIENTDPSRQTLGIENRLDQIVADPSRDLSDTLEPRERSIGTCRDFALMTCSFLRHKQLPARVRCGFATYFTPGRFSDHWICEYWQSEHNRWVKIDAQLDENHQNHLEISFDTTKLPDGVFVNAGEAWQLHRDKGIAADLFSFNEHAGRWLMWVNLARDLLSLAGHETSAWDEWRTVADNPPQLSDDDRLECDQLTLKIKTCEQRVQEIERPQPFWNR